MYKVGITGGIASGKSTVVKWLKAHGAQCIDADVVAREVVAVGTPGLAAIKEYFGPDVVDENGELRRDYLGSIVFNDEAKRAKLNEILKVYIRERIHELADEYERAGESAILFDIPLMYETDWHKEMDEIWLVYVSPKVQLKRLMKRNGYTEGEAQSRINSQMSLEAKKDLAPVVIYNSKSMKRLKTKLNELWQEKSHLFEGAL